MDNMNDMFTSIIIILFILSLISERISNFVKLYLKLDKRRSDPAAERKRQNNIMTLNWVCGLGVAIWGYFTLEAHETFTSLFAFSHDDLAYSIGVILFSSFFLSFGSKFWHDLLDLVFQVKNLRRKLVEEKTFQINHFPDLIDHINSPSEAVAQKTLEENMDSINTIPGVQAIGVGTKMIGEKKQPVIDIHVTDQGAAQKIDPFLTTIVEEEVKRTPTRIILTDETRAHVAFPGGAIKNRGGVGAGTLSCLVEHKDTQQLYIMSCYHVLKAKTHHWNWFSKSGDPSTEEIIYGEHGDTIGNLEFGFCNNHFDIGLAKVTSPNNIATSIINNQGKIRGICPVTPSDKYNGSKIKIIGKNSTSFKSGIIWDDSVVVKMKYYHPTKSTPVHIELFEHFFSITNTAGEKLKGVSEPGDSGALVLNKENRVMGIIVGGNDKFSYALRIEHVLKSLKLRIKLQLENN